MFKIVVWFSFAVISRKDTNLQNLGAAETKLLYTLHWIILHAAEECADADREKGIYHASPFYYLFSIPAISVSGNIISVDLRVLHSHYHTGTA
jgi:hypothetical protein